MITFDELSQRRRDYVEISRVNGFEEGLRRLLADLYPDNAHFIYELLQNAEDAGAGEVTFTAQADGLLVEHDGQRLFDLADVDSITGIGQSTKADDETAIGKFGVGFKAVFAYTQTPEVHSGDQSFAIRDLFVPERVPSRSRLGMTGFWFPFDRPEKPTTQALSEVETALRELSRETLLFLTNIRTIGCSFVEGDERLLERRDLGDHIVEIDSAHDDGGPSYWYRITGDAVVDGKTRGVAAAFALRSRAPRPGEAASSIGYSVTPTDGQVFIYFPAVKETSGLHFHVHAPFASTVARDSVREDVNNETLLARIGDLIVAALPEMRDSGLVTDDLLQALPNAEDNLPDRYTTLRDRIIHAFDTLPITPTVDRAYAPATLLIRADAQIRAAMTVEDANTLIAITNTLDDSPPTSWLPDRDRRAREFLNSLSSLDLGETELAQILDRVGDLHEADNEDLDGDDLQDLASWQQWIAAKDDASLRAIYVALASVGSQSRRRLLAWHPTRSLADGITHAPLVRVRSGSGVDHVVGEEAFLPIARGLALDHLVPDPLAVFEPVDPADRGLHDFYIGAGVRPWDAAEELDQRFTEYEHKPAVGDEQHLADLTLLERLVEDKSVSASTFCRRPIFLAESANGDLAWTAAADVYIDSSSSPTGLASLYATDGYEGRARSRLADQYLSDEANVTSLASALGAMTKPVVTETRAWRNPAFQRAWRTERPENQNMVSRDWVIDDFDAICDFGDETLLRSLWQVVASTAESCAIGTYRANGSSPTRTFESRLLLALKNTSWVLDRDGNCATPAAMTVEELARGLSLPANSPMLRLAGFGRAAERAAVRQGDDDKRAQEYGLSSADELFEIVELYRRDPEAFKQLGRAIVLPDGSSAAPEHRAQVASEVATQAQRRQYDRRVRSVHIQEPGHRSASRSYLTQLYTNDDHVMICQICLSEMPFKVDQAFYFEAVQFVSDSSHDLRENRLALCPTCAAKYRHARSTTDTEMREDLLTQTVDRQASVTVAVVLVGTAHRVRFVGKHAIDLQAALQVHALDLAGGGPVKSDD